MSEAVFDRILFSSKSDHWSTPVALYDELNSEFNFNFDPCPLMSTKDGRKGQWTGRVFCNPPYSDILAFLTKGLYHLSVRDCELLVFLVPARTDTAWFHDYCYGKSEIRFLRGRIKFGGAKYNAPFPSMVVVFREWGLPPPPLFSEFDITAARAAAAIETIAVRCQVAPQENVEAK